MALNGPVILHQPLSSFDDVYSPRILATMNDYDFRIAHTHSDHLWHRHENTNEFFLVLAERFDMASSDADGTERMIELNESDTFVVPNGTEHGPSSPGGSILTFEPSGTTTTGDHDGVVPDHVDSTTGRRL